MFRILRVSSLLLAALLTSVASFGAQGSQRIATAIANVGSNARILANAQITVCSYNVSHPDCSAPITVYEDPALTIPYPTTPFRADGNGNYSYWVAAGNYVEQVCATGAQCTLQVITLGGPGGGGTVTPCGTVGQIQIADTGGSNLNCDPNFFIDPTGHTFNSTANMVINAVSSLPRATYDPMDGNRDGGLAAAIAGTSGFTPTQVLQATIDYGECQILMSKTVFTGEKIPLPAKVTMNIGQVLLWTNTDFGGDNQGSVGTYPLLQHNDATKVMVAFHAAGDTITCSNGTTYNPIPGGASGGYIHDFVISGMGAVSTTTDIGIETNSESTVVRNIIAGGQIFGGPAIFSAGTSDFLQQLGYPNGNIQGCKTYTSGTLPVADFGPGICGSVFGGSLDGGMENVYATDGQAFSSGHAAGACYPKCAAIVLGASGAYGNDLFAQVSDIDFLFAGTATRANNLRADFTAEEAVRIAGTGANKISQLSIDSSCTDTSLQAPFNAGTPTGCAALVDTSQSGSDQTTNVTVVNNAGIFASSFNQCFIEDTRTGFSGTSDMFSQVTYQGATANTTANSWAFCGTFDGSQVSGKVVFPSQAPMQATGTTVNVSGINSVFLAGQTVSTITAGISGQRISITGPGILHQGTGIATNNLRNLNGMDSALSAGQVAEFVNIEGLSNSIWQMVSGPANQTPTHVNYAGNATPSNPSLLDVYGNAQARQVPGFTLFVNQIHGPTAGTGQACFEEQALFSDGKNVVSPLACTTVDLSAQTPGEIFAVSIPQASLVLYLVSNTEGNGVSIGKYPAPCPAGAGACPLWDGPTTIAAGGDGSAAPAASENNTGSAILAFGIYGPATAPSGTCTAGQGGALVLSQDGHATFCPVGGGTWATKF